MKNFFVLSLFCFLFLFCAIGCGSDTSTDVKDQQTISLEEIKAGQTNPVEKEKAIPTAYNETKETTKIIPPKEEKEKSEEAVEELTEKSVAKVEEKPKKVKIKEEKKPAPKKKRRKGIMKFSEKTYKFGTITEGDKVEHKFFFTNVGKKPINVKEASATCGCTYPSHPFVPIKPGEKSYIGVSFNSTGKEGKQRPKVTVVTDSDLGTFNLYLDGKVELKPKEETPTEEKTEEN